MSIFEISVRKYIYAPNFSVTRSVELEKSAFSDFQWRPSWISKWPPSIRSNHLEMSIFEISTPKYLCILDFKAKPGVEHEKSFIGHFSMAAILDFKMAADPLVRSRVAGNFWNQRLKIPLCAKFHTFCRIRASWPFFVTYLLYYFIPFQSIILFW